MGNCCSDASSPQDARKLGLNVAFNGAPPVVVGVKESDTLGQVREKTRAVLSQKGRASVSVHGAIMTMRAGGGEAVRISDNTTVRKARLENRQTIWFSDDSEDARVAAVVLRGSNLTANVASNSRGVKRGMKMLGRDR